MPLRSEFLLNVKKSSPLKNIELHKNSSQGTFHVLQYLFVKLYVLVPRKQWSYL